MSGKELMNALAVLPFDSRRLIYFLTVYSERAFKGRGRWNSAPVTLSFPPPTIVINTRATSLTIPRRF